MTWRIGEVWLDPDLRWFREHPALAASGAADVVELPRFGPAETGLDASRRRRLAAKTARRRRLATRTVPALALVVGSTTTLPIASFRHRDAGEGAAAALEDPPSLTLRLDDFGFRLPERKPKPTPKLQSRVEEPATEPVRVNWHHATSVGLQYAGRLIDGTQLPQEGPNWVTWNPATDSSPNLPGRLYGNEHTIRAILSVLSGYRAAHPDAPRVVVGDISFRRGGRMDEHVSHQNGLDVDIYYPRLDRRATVPTSPGDVDRGLAQDLLDRFIAEGAKVVFVGYSTGLRGESGVVVPYPNHENHMHVRFPAPV
jgi:Penicillin-insensitive murein endopeptidase